MTEAKPTGLYEALAAFQKELPAIAKRETAKIEGREGRQGYKYDYAPLDAVAEKVMPLLGKHGLAFVSKPTLADGRFVLAYKLTHASGDSEDGEYPLPANGTPQDLGKAISYARRYCLCAITGVAPGGEDNDAQGVPAHATEKPRPQSREEAAPPEHSEDTDDGDWGVWHDVIKDITTPEEADQADQDLREVFKTGAMGPTKAGNIRAAIKGRKAEVAGPPSPNGKRREEVPA